MRTALIPVLTAIIVSGCASTQPAAPAGFAATLAPTAATTVVPDYRIGPLDVLTITVFQVEDLTLKDARVDAGGNIALPLVGSVNAAGKTTSELSAEIAKRLQANFLQSPQVSVMVKEAVSQRVTVDGAVTEPGVFELKGRTTLIQVVAMAKGPNRAANLHRVAVFRTGENGQRTAAVFDLAAIRSGKAEDPTILGNDVVVVDSSALKGAMREVLTALPAFAIFRPY